MQLVTAQLSERVEHLMDIAELQAAADAAAQVEQVAEATTGRPRRSATLVADAGAEGRRPRWLSTIRTC